MAHMTLAILQEKAGYINLTMPKGYFIKVSQRKGHTAVDLYHNRNMIRNLMCGTPRECGLALDLLYRVSMEFEIGFKMN